MRQLIKKVIPFAVPALRAMKHRASKVKIRRMLRERSAISIEVGSGDKPGNGQWVTIDMTKKCDIFWDLRKGLPFPDGRLQNIYSSHFLEHLSFNDAQRFLDECLRALAPGGKFSICVPNARIYLEAYISGKSLDETKFLAYTPAYHHTTCIDYVNYMAYMDGEHKYMFDEENLLYILRSKGFKDVRLRRFDPDLDLEARDLESIYAEAEK
jgi:predicted SAM-dependent methyltransferase